MIGSIGSISRRTRLNSQHCGLVSSAGLHLEVNVGRRKPRAAWTWNSRYDPAGAHEPRQKSRMSPFPSLFPVFSHLRRMKEKWGRHDAVASNFKRQATIGVRRVTE